MKVSAVAGRPSSSRAAASGPARPGLCRLGQPAQPCRGVGRRPARPGGDSGLCRPNSESCCLACSAGRPGLVARSGTRCDSIRAPDRGRKRGRRGSSLRRGRGRGGEGRGGEGGKRHGQLEASAVASPLLHAWVTGLKCRRAHRDKQARALTQSCAGTRAEPRRQHARRA
jgi:hypothetical protein